MNKRSILLPEIVLDAIVAWGERLLEDQAADEADSDDPRWELKTAYDDEIHGRYYVEFTDGEGWYEAGVRRDGCIHFYRYFNSPWGGDGENRLDNVDHLHICDIDDMIDRLQALKAAAIEQFGKAWPC